MSRPSPREPEIARTGLVAKDGGETEPEPVASPGGDGIEPQTSPPLDCAAQPYR